MRLLESVDQIDFDKLNGLVPAVVQDDQTRNILMVGFMNKEAVHKTIDTKKVTFFSRSKNHLWTKGETSGNFLHLSSLNIDCDNDTLLVKAHPEGPTCHKGDDTCFQELNSPNGLFLNYLQEIIRLRREDNTGKSYTRSLFDKGINKIAQKVGEEAVETVIEAKDNNEELFQNEVADLLFHLLVLLEAKDTDLNDIIKVLKERHSK